jgi:hypothetical protein
MSGMAIAIGLTGRIVRHMPSVRAGWVLAAAMIVTVVVGLLIGM